MGSEAYLEAHSQQHTSKDSSDLYLEAAEDDDDNSSTSDSSSSSSKTDDQDRGEAVVV